MLFVKEFVGLFVVMLPQSYNIFLSPTSKVFKPMPKGILTNCQHSVKAFCWNINKFVCSKVPETTISGPKTSPKCNTSLIKVQDAIMLLQSNIYQIITSMSILGCPIYASLSISYAVRYRQLLFCDQNLAKNTIFC